MSPERFRQIEELYHAAHAKSGQERMTLLADADPELRRAVESLLAQPNSGEFLDRPALENASKGNASESVDPTVTIFTAATQLGPYRIESKLGEGGMGEVFRAIDTRLGRAVAIKTAHERFTARFEREARAISSLNHSHICTLYDVGPNYLVMELVEGETIAAHLKREAFRLGTALVYASQIAAALVEAHSKGVIHRDLKPGNIMIAKSGVKVLDFGLAKSGADETLTASNVVMGTPAYMSPEQREGKSADARSDIYSFGCVLYEMITGARASGQRKRISSRKVERIVSRCLEADPARRWQSAADLERELTGASAPLGPGYIVAAAAVVCVVAGGAYAYFHRAPKLTDKDTIILADFENKTGDPVFDDTLRQGLTIELQQSPFLNLIPDQKVQATLALMAQPKDAPVTSGVALEVCERTGSAAVLEGSIANLGSQYILGLRAQSCGSGATLDQEQIQSARREDVPNSLSQIARKFRIKVGESLATIEKHSVPLQEATTPSLDALKAYSSAMSLDSTAAIPLLKRAVEIDPKFALAYANMGLAYSDIGESVLSAEATKRAWELRDRVSDQEKFYIDFTYQRQVTGNLEEAYQTLELWLQTYPRAEDPLSLLGGLSTHGTGRFERAIEVSKTYLATDPGNVFGYHNLASSYFFLNRFPEAESVLRQASEHKAQEPYSLVLKYNIAALRGDKDQMAQLAAAAKGKRGAEHWLAHEEALALARSGRLHDAQLSSTRAIELALQEGDREKAASYGAARAVWEALYGNAAEAKKAAVSALDASKGRDVEYMAGLALALSGDPVGSDAAVSDLVKRFPEDTIAKFDYVPVLRALSASNAGGAANAPAQSLEDLQIALQYELAVNGLNFNHFYLGGLHSAYIRGRAFSAAHRYAEAAGEFQKILNHRGLVALDPIGAAAYLDLGRALASAGDAGKAKGAYQDFLNLWQDADPNVPILQKAKVEFTKLH